MNHQGDHIIFRPYFNPTDPNEITAKARRVLRGVKYDTMVCRGMSGNLVVPVISRTLRKNFLAIRKPGENSHDDARCVGVLGKRWIFVDDFIDTGKTFREVHKAMTKIVSQATGRGEEPFSEFVGAFLYSRDTFNTAEHMERYL